MEPILLTLRFPYTVLNGILRTREVNVVLVVVAVFAVLALIIPLIEKATGGKPSPSYPKVAKWILPLVFVSLIIQLIYQLTR
jgi:hypothetical protein